MHTFHFYDFQIYAQPGLKGEDDVEPHSVEIQVDLKCTSRGYPPQPWCDYPDPGAPSEWEVDEVRLVNPSMQSVVLTESQFAMLFPDGQDILNNAIEDAVQNGDVE